MTGDACPSVRPIVSRAVISRQRRNATSSLDHKNRVVGVAPAISPPSRIRRSQVAFGD
jgi:hypothetical protein